ncbi:SUKH-4 family immunity protein [Streptomyces sp. SS7]|uniref:SUKH-4 family immunity protein n=1 Tax=Streptomyces sp. SS7 TaxID=3108485 RepID=UPI0030EB2A40
MLAETAMINVAGSAAPDGRQHWLAYKVRVDAVMSGHREALADFLSRPLSLLIVDDDQIVAHNGDIGSWNLAEVDKHSLMRWGIPLIEECRLIPNFQEGSSPELERRSQSFYGLGLFAGQEIGALVDVGEVWAFPPDEELPNSFVNSSVAHFVETSWRWYWTWKEVQALRFDIEQYDLLDDFLEFAIRLDPRVGSAEQSIWRGFIQSW